MVASGVGETVRCVFIVSLESVFFIGVLAKFGGELYPSWIAKLV
jgi:hypothetical protein